MKYQLALAIALATVCQSQDLLQNRHGVGHGKDYTQPSEKYVARGPYTVEWSAKSTYKLSRYDPAWKGKDNSSCVHVFDADSGRMVASSPWGGLTGSLRVPTGGRHYLKVFSLGEWDANIIEDPEFLKQADRYGLLSKTGVVTQQMIDAKRTETEKNIEAASAKGMASPSTVPAKIPATKPSSDPGLPPGMERVKKQAKPEPVTIELGK